jgi:hypothetical protein
MSRIRSVVFVAATLAFLGAVNDARAAERFVDAQAGFSFDLPCPFDAEPAPRLANVSGMVITLDCRPVQLVVSVGSPMGDPSHVNEELEHPTVSNSSMDKVRLCAI